MSTLATSPVQAVLDRLEGVKPTGPDKWQARCPAHDDRMPSLCVGTGDDGRALLSCMAGCPFDAIVKALGIQARDLFPPKHAGNGHAANGKPKLGRIVATYDYTDAGGTLLYQTVRYDPKDFRQRRPDGAGGWEWSLNGAPRVLYKLPALLATDPQERVFVTEGERDADALAAVGLTATTAPQGAGKFKHVDATPLQGRRVVIWPDRDEPGRRHAEDVAARLQGVAAEVRVLSVPGSAKDAADFVEERDSVEAVDIAGEIMALVEATPAWEAPSANPMPKRLTGSAAAKQVNRVNAQIRGEHAPAYVLTPGLHVDGDDQAHEVGTNDFAREVLDALPDGALYRKDDAVGCIAGGRFRLADVDDVRQIVDSAVRLGAWRISKDTKQPCLIYLAATRDHAGLVTSAARQHAGVRDLRLLTRYPVFQRDWTLTGPGWNAADGIYYHAPEALADLSPVDDIPEIRRALDDLVIDFPWREEADRHNFMGLLFTPLIRPAVDGNVPAHGVTASMERTGKTKATEQVFGRLYLGESLPAMQLHEREEENEKRILGMLLADANLIHLDNVRTTIDSASLASLLTARTFAGRILGASRIVCLPNNTIVVATGNNLSASGENAKRFIPIRLQPRDEHPERRADFAHPDLPAYIDGVRRHVLGCLIGAVGLWLRAGRPRHGPTLGGFESWAACVGGILGLLSYDQWRTNEASWHRAADPYGVDLGLFVEGWFADYQLQPVTTADLCSAADRRRLFTVCFTGNTPRAHQTSFAKRVLRRNVDRPCGRFIIRQDTSGSSSFWRLEAV